MAQTPSKKRIFDDRYEIIEIVGRSKHSVVYHARYLAPPHEEVALKVLLNRNDQPSAVERLRKEALALVTARHPHVVRLDDFHSVGDLCYLAMEYAPEVDLRRYVDQGGQVLPVEQAERFLLQVAEALAYIHGAGIIHRDIKAENILVIDDGTVKVADFSVALLPGDPSSIDELRKGVGSMDYMSPDVLEGRDPDIRDDIYSLGVTFYELLTGINPFAEQPLVQQIEIRKDGSFPDIRELAPHVPRHLRSVVMRAMRFLREDRFQSASELIEALEKAKRRRAKADLGPRRARGEEPQREKQPTVAVSREDMAGLPEELAIEEALEKINPFGAIPAGIDSPTTPESAMAHVAPDIAHVVEEIGRSPTAQIPAHVVEEIRKAREELPTEPPPTKTPTTPSRQPWLIAGGVVMALLLLWALFGGGSTTPKEGSTVAAIETNGSTTSGDVALSFPKLAAGTYAGSIDGLLGASHPLLMVSLPDRSMMVVMVGIEGWSPAMVDVSKASPERPVRVVANGFMLELTGAPTANRIEGSFVNRVSGEGGTWFVAPRR